MYMPKYNRPYSKNKTKQTNYGKCEVCPWILPKKNNKQTHERCVVLIWRFSVYVETCFHQATILHRFLAIFQACTKYHCSRVRLWLFKCEFPSSWNRVPHFLHFNVCLVSFVLFWLFRRVLSFELFPVTVHRVTTWYNDFLWQFASISEKVYSYQKQVPAPGPLWARLLLPPLLSNAPNFKQKFKP